MRADRVEVTWDKSKSNWLVRITSGEEVIRRAFQDSEGFGRANTSLDGPESLTGRGLRAGPHKH